jgi:hypothetical protein
MLYIKKSKNHLAVITIFMHILLWSNKMVINKKGVVTIPY